MGMLDRNCEKLLLLIFLTRCGQELRRFSFILLKPDFRLDNGFTKFPDAYLRPTLAIRVWSGMPVLRVRKNKSESDLHFPWPSSRFACSIRTKTDEGSRSHPLVQQR